MPKFEYRVRTTDGKTLTGGIDAPNSDIAMDTLRDKGFFVVSLEEGKAEGFDLNSIPILGDMLNKVGIKDIVIFSRQFSVLMGASVPLMQSLTTVGRQTENATLQKILFEVSDEVEAGSSLSSCLEKYPKAFTPFFIHMVRSGETTGQLEQIMNYLADQMEKDYDLNQRIKGAMIYPTVVIIGLVIVGFIMMTFVVPKLTATLIESGAKLPWTTQVLIFVSSACKKYWIQIIVLAVAGYGTFKWWTSTVRGKYLWDKYKMKLPVFGPLTRLISVVRFTQSFGTMLIGGVDIPNCLQVTADVVGNAYFSELILETKREVVDGNALTTVFARERAMPDMVTQMMSVGEETGRMGEVLDRLTQFYTRELQNAVSNLVHAIEPIIMLVMGGAVGIMVAAIMLPMYQMATNM